MSKRILLVDDEPDFVDLVSVRLIGLGYEVITATNGLEALELIKDARPDLILLDLVLPLMDGYVLCKKVKADPDLKQIPIILFTASVVHDLKEKAKNIKADDYIMKPFDPKVLAEKIKNLIS